MSRGLAIVAGGLKGINEGLTTGLNIVNTIESIKERRAKMAQNEAYDKDVADFLEQDEQESQKATTEALASGATPEQASKAYWDSTREKFALSMSKIAAKNRRPLEAATWIRTLNNMQSIKASGAKDADELSGLTQDRAIYNIGIANGKLGPAAIKAYNHNMPDELEIDPEKGAEVKGDDLILNLKNGTQRVLSKKDIDEFDQYAAQLAQKGGSAYTPPTTGSEKAQVSAFKESINVRIRTLTELLKSPALGRTDPKRAIYEKEIDDLTDALAEFAASGRMTDTRSLRHKPATPNKPDYSRRGRQPSTLVRGKGSTDPDAQPTKRPSVSTPAKTFESEDDAHAAFDRGEIKDGDMIRIGTKDAIYHAQ